MKSNIILVSFLLCMTIFISGCTDEELSAGEIAAKMEEKQANIQDMSATVHMTVTMDYETQETEYEVIQKKPDKSKTTVTQPEELAGQVTVSDGETTWMYYPATNEVTVMTIPELSGQFQMEYSGIISDVLNESNVSVVGMEEYEGRDTFVVIVKPEENESIYGSGEMKLWIDDETWTPLKMESGSPGEFQILVEYRNFEVNTGISDDEFEFEIPEGARVTEIDDMEDLLPAGMTLEEAQQLSDFEILAPSYMPEAYSLVNVIFSNNSIMTSAEESLTLFYSNGTNSILISESFYNGSKDENPFKIESEKVSFNGIEGDFYPLNEESGMLRWETDGAVLTVTASLDREEIIKIAGSME